MTETEIQELETATGGSLPAVYRELLLNYPQRLTDLATMLGIEELELLYHTRESLIRVNGEHPECLHSIFPPHYFVIGENGCGDLYAIDTRSAAAPVYMGGPHLGEYPEDAEGNPLPCEDSLQEYIAFVVTVYEEAILSENERDDTRVYQPPGMLTEWFSIALSLLLMPVLLMLLLLTMIVTGPFILLGRLWERLRPVRN